MKIRKGKELARRMGEKLVRRKQIGAEQKDGKHRHWLNRWLVKHCFNVVSFFVTFVSGDIL
jgi:hypothetical protein